MAKKSTQTENGKAFEFALLKELQDQLSKIIKVDIVKDKPFFTAKTKFDEIDSIQRAEYQRAAGVAVHCLRDMEPCLSNDIDQDDTLQLEILSDRHGQDGDVRDVRISRKNQDWEIGISAKVNNDAVKHSRLSETIDFGKDWLELGCSENYFDAVKKVFDPLKQMKLDSNSTAIWSSLPAKDSTVYYPILTAFKDELNRLYETNPQVVPRKLVQYLVGVKDFYKVIKSGNKLEVVAFNIFDTLNLDFKQIEPALKTPQLGLPTKILDISFKENKKNTLLVTLNNDWKFSFRIHNASSRIENSLKFDVRLTSTPNIFKREFAIKENN
jgi:hypothetical protein